jgi:cation diffusion facilitator CzcD-associated flavoprotein CzcO
MAAQTDSEDGNNKMVNGQTPRVCVVGAGPSGLTTTKTLLEAGLDVDCYDISPHIGGHWVIENPNGKSSAYRSLRTNTTKRMSRFSDFDMPADWPEFPSYDYVRKWLESYVDAFGFRTNISTGTEVVSAIPRAKGGWQVTLECNGNRSTKSYDALVAASGSYWDQQLPTWPGHFDGTIFHAQDYLDPSTPHDTKGKNVIIVGVGNTGCELACEIARSDAQNVYLSARSGTWIMPKTIDGVPAAEGVPMNHPTDEVPVELQQLPEDEREQLLEHLASQKIKENYGERMQRFEALGMPATPDQPLLKRPTMSQGLLEHLEKGDLRVMPAIAELKGDYVVFDNGEAIQAELIIAATGYKLTYPYLSQDVADTSGNDLTLFCGIVAPDRHDLFFIGVSRPSGAFWPIAEAQAKFVASLLSGAYALPAQGEIERRARPMLNRPAMSPGLYGLALREELAGGMKQRRSS